jgi:hypothetical protein
MADLVVIVPSRGRPEAVADLARTCKETCTADTVLLVVLDTDDQTAPEYAAAVSQTVYFTSAEPAGHVGAINAGAKWALQDFEPFAVAKLDDDHRPRTHGWDQLLLDELRSMKTGIAYGNDLLQGARLPTAPVMTADIVSALGYMGPPTLRHLYVDDFWRDLGQAAGCLRYVPSVVVEHMHPAAGKAAWDEGYARANDPGQYERDGGAYRSYLAGPFADDVAKVKALLPIVGEHGPEVVWLDKGQHVRPIRP